MGCRPFLPLALAFVLALAGSARAEDPAPPVTGATQPDTTSGSAVPFQYEETELPEIVKAVAERTGLRFLFDDRLRGRVTITAPRPVQKSELLELLGAALRLAGYNLVRAPGDAYDIVPLADSAGRVAFSESTPRAFVDTPVTTLVPLHAARAEALLPVVQPMLGASAVVQAFAPTNTLILSSSEAQLHRALLVIRALDRAEERRLAVLRPRFRDATDLLPMVQDTFPETRRASESLRVFADAHSNALLIEGPEALVKEVKAFVATVDLPVTGQGGIRVVRILHADAETLGKVIQEASTAGAAPSRGTPAGAPVATEMGDALRGREFALSVDKPTNSLVIRSDAETFLVMARLIAALDLDVPSVSVKTTLLEIEDNDDLSVAIDTIFPFLRPGTPGEGNGFARTLNSGDPSLLGLRPSDANIANDGFVLRFLKDPVTFTRVGPDGTTVTDVIPSYGVDIRAQATVAKTKLLSEPTILAQSGEEQEIFIGNNIPILSATNTSAAGTTAPAATPAAVSAANPLVISQNVQRQDVGVRLRVKPSVPEEGPVRLELRIEFSDVTASLAGSVEDVGPTLIKQSVESTIYLDDGAGAVVGVRGQPTQQTVETGSPWLMDVPILGQLFRSRATQTVRKDLVLAVQVQVIRSARDLELESIRRRVAMERSVAGLDALPVSPADAPFAVWIATVDGREAAETLAASLDVGPERAAVVPWKTGDPRRFDVYVFGFDRYADAMKTSLRAQAQGYTPEVVALPGGSE